MSQDVENLRKEIERLVKDSNVEGFYSTMEREKSEYSRSGVDNAHQIKLFIWAYGEIYESQRNMDCYRSLSHLLDKLFWEVRLALMEKDDVEIKERIEKDLRKFMFAGWAEELDNLHGINKENLDIVKRLRLIKNAINICRPLYERGLLQTKFMADLIKLYPTLP